MSIQIWVIFFKKACISKTIGTLEKEKGREGKTIHTHAHTHPSVLDSVQKTSTGTKDLILNFLTYFGTHKA
jgi:hypothetical protein